MPSAFSDSLLASRGWKMFPDFGIDIIEKGIHEIEIEINTTCLVCKLRTKLLKNGPYAGLSTLTSEIDPENTR